MEEIIYREIKESDYQSIKELLNETWNIEKIVQNKKLLDKVLDGFLRISLMDSSFSSIAVRDGTVIGIILGHVKGEKKCYGFIRHIFRVLCQGFSILFYPRNDRHCIMEYLKLFKVYKELMKNRKDMFSGNVVLLALSKHCHGLGIGKTLMNNLFAYFKGKSEKPLYVYTDTACNYGFYDHIGFKRLDAKELAINLSSATIKETIFLYQYQF